MSREKQPNPERHFRLTADQEAELQYRSALNANYRRRLYQYSNPPRNIWIDIAKNMPLKGDETIIDAGTGNGLFLEILHSKFKHRGSMLGIDLHVHQFFKGWQKLMQRKGSLAPIAFQHGDAQKIHFPDNSVDAFSALFLMYHVPNPEAVAAEAKRIVKPGGLAVFSSRDVENLEKIWTLAGLAAEEIGAVQHEPFYRRCDISRTKDILTSGFEIIFEDIQDSPLEIPADKKSGDSKGWDRYRQAFLSLSDSMIDAQTGNPLSPDQLHALVDYADTTIRELFEYEVENREKLEGKAYMLDRVRQGYFICRNTK